MAFDPREETKWTVPRRLGTAIVMGAVVSAMHYTGMAAARFPPRLRIFSTLRTSPLGINGITIVTLIVLVAGITTSSVERRVSAEVRRLNEDLERGVAGLDFQGELAETNIQIPIIFVTAHGDIPIAVRAMKAGAVEFLTKPFRHQDLLDAIQQALGRDRTRRAHEAEIAALLQRFQSLTGGERKVLPLVVSGRPNKQIAGEIGTSEATVKVHRSQLMKKMGADSLPELVRLAEKIGIPG